MPQHPQYSNSVEKNLEDLYSLLNELEKFGFIHEELHQPIDSLMSNLNSEATARHVLANYPPSEKSSNEEDDEEDNFDDDWHPVPSVGDLWFYIEEDEKEQFIQDFRNVISLCMYENGFALADDNDTINRLIEMRDINYYQMHVRVELDLEAIKKFEDIERTPWFPEDVSPTRSGVYEVSRVDKNNLIFDGYASWNGKGWTWSRKLLKEAIAASKNKKDHSDWKSHCWRGFAEEVK